MSSYELTNEEQDQLLYWKQICSKYPVLKSHEQIALVVQFQAGNKRSGDKIILHNMRLVVNLAKKHSGKGIPVGELINEGVLGLNKACIKFEAERGFKFSTYATWWIRQAITRAIENKGKIIRIPSHRQQLANRVRWAYRQLVERRADDGDFDSPSMRKKIAEMVGITPEEVSECGRYLQDHISLSQLVNEDENTTLEDYVGADLEHQPEEIVERTLDRDLIDAAIDTLPAEDAAFIRFRFGWLDGAEKTARQMSVFSQRPPSENSKREARILEHLRQNIDLDLLNNFRPESR